MMRVVVHIDRLVVNGPPSGRRAIEAAIGEGIRRELSRPGAVAALVASGSHARVHAGPVRAGAGHSGLGAAIGRSLVRRGRA